MKWKETGAKIWVKDSTQVLDLKFHVKVLVLAEIALVPMSQILLTTGCQVPSTT